MVKINLQDFKPVQVKTHTLVPRGGGMVRKEFPLPTKDVKLEGSLSVATFVRIRTWCEWLSYAVMGKKFKAYLHSQVLLKDLEKKIVPRTNE